MFLFSRQFDLAGARHIHPRYRRCSLHGIATPPPLPTPTTKSCFASLLRSYSYPKHLKQIHALILTTGLSIKNSLLTQILQILSLSGEMCYARNLFDEMHKPRVFLWNTLMRGYFKSKLCTEALEIYHQMHRLGVRPDEFTFPFVLKSCTALLDNWVGMEVHAMVVKHGLDFNNIVSTELVVMYVKFGDADYADDVFESMGNGRDLVSWNALIAAYSQYGRADKAIAHFQRMESAGVEPDTITLACVLSSCSYLGCLELGKKLYFRIKEGFLPSNIFVENALLDLFAKCGSMDVASELFDEMPIRNVVSWSTVIGGYAINGESQRALSLFFQMCDEGVRPNDVTMLNVLSACSHAGLVKQGKELFSSIAKPTIEHCAAMVDLLGRSGHLEEAYGFIQSMSMDLDAGVWGALLNSCIIQHNTELGELAADELLKLAPETPSYQVLLSNMYAALGRWNEVEKIREWMRLSDFRKVIGYSSVELDGEVLVFHEGSHAQSEKLHQLLCELTSTVRGIGYRPVIISALHDLEEEEKEAALMAHSERLAIAFSLMYSNNIECPLRIMKNLRICNDCHEFCKYVSKAMKREIIMRDKSRFHHFKDGQCSCTNFW
ncbi:pentatricopeptide repeat-containing protein At2g01510, mitochondrial [Dendrobium catenatum]|uniref:Pentatricopeptide repeat-containing protein n=1 Tax=Dendrobium catenatum TaxID=906689 RepID=A0A2I0V972_9ASPA|nr:pentatricopeptide repeat-containing protein At2g01510, mitochondrial [Dendrobium catenatum]PKU59965.1 Pentatricopeptide repeat-containing protein [Dendrobium catenatum]